MSFRAYLIKESITVNDITLIDNIFQDRLLWKILNGEYSIKFGFFCEDKLQEKEIVKMLYRKSKISLGLECHFAILQILGKTKNITAIMETPMKITFICSDRNILNELSRIMVPIFKSKYTIEYLS